MQHPPPHTQTNKLRLAALEVAAERLAAQQRTPALALSDAVSRLEARVAEGEEKAEGLEGRLARGREAGEVGFWGRWIGGLGGLFFCFGVDGCYCICRGGGMGVGVGRSVSDPCMYTCATHPPPPLCIYTT